jgi:hypothetical protein
MNKLVPMGVCSPYTSEQMVSILKCVNANKGRVEKIVVGAAIEYMRSINLPKLKRPNPDREISELKNALHSLEQALSSLSGESRLILDSARRAPGATDCDTFSSIDDASFEPMDCAALSNSVHLFLIENKIGLEMEVRSGALPGRPKVSDKRQLLDRLDLAFAAGHRGPSRPTFLALCGSPESMNLNKTWRGAGNWWDDLDRKKTRQEKAGLIRRKNPRVFHTECSNFLCSVFRPKHGLPKHSGPCKPSNSTPLPDWSRAMRRLSDADIAILERFERLPDSAAAPIKICALVSGISERTWRRNPPIQTFPLSAGKKGANVGLLRKLARGELAPTAA